MELITLKTGRTPSLILKRADAGTSDKEITVTVNIEEDPMDLSMLNMISLYLILQKYLKTYRINYLRATTMPINNYNLYSKIIKRI